MVNCADLVDDVTRLSMEATWNTEWVWLPSRCQRSDDECAQMTFSSSGDTTTHGLFGSLPVGRVDEEDLATPTPRHHFQSSSSKRVGVSSSRRPRRCHICFATSAHPDRGRGALRIMRAPPRTRTSTSSVRPASSMRGLGSRTPRELPMRTRRAFMVRVLRRVPTMYPRRDAESSEGSDNAHRQSEHGLARLMRERTPHPRFLPVRARAGTGTWGVTDHYTLGPWRPWVSLGGRHAPVLDSPDSRLGQR